MMSTRTTAACALLFALFVAAGLIFVPYTGVQYDEALFVSALYADNQVEHVMKLPFGRVPIMLLSYMGTFKAGIYAALLQVLEPTVWTLRVPMLLAAALSVVIFFLAIRRLAGDWPAFLAALLLSTDVIYLMTSVYDWGPVALQHLLFTSALYCGVRFAQQKETRMLFLAALLSGLALWDKALFIWLLAGGGLALLILWPRELIGIARNRRWLGIAALGFVLGSLPFLYYNKIHRLNTFRANIAEHKGDRTQKLQMLDATLNGSGLFGYMVRGEPEGPPANLQYWEKIPLFVATRLKAPSASWQSLLLVGCVFYLPALLFSPFARQALFPFITFVVAWGLMIYGTATGGAAHHTVLLWPLPQWLLACVLADLARRWPGRGLKTGGLLVLLCAGSNLVVLNQHLAQLIAAGPSWIWTDATEPLVRSIQSRPTRSYLPVDWGIQQQIMYYGKGAIPLVVGGDGATVQLPAPWAAAVLDKALADPSTVFITHSEGREAFQGVRGRFLAYAKEKGFTGNVIAQVRDRHGSPVYELWEMTK